MEQKMIVFENILKGDSLVENKEIKALCNYVFGECNLALGTSNRSEKLQEWLSDETYKAIGGEYVMGYPVKEPLSAMKNANASEEYVGPVTAFMFEPDAAVDDNIIVITCKWKGEIFTNNLYVIGVIANADDIERIIKTKLD